MFLGKNDILTNIKAKSFFVHIFSLVLIPALSACAVRGGGGKGTRYDIDEAAIFGRQVTAFVLPDGSEASLREFKGQYSVKIHRYSRVVDIDKAETVKFRSTAQVDGYALVILEKSRSNCARMTQLLAIRDREVRVWELGNCRSAPEITIGKSAALFDVPEGKQATRYQFQDGKLRYGSIAFQPRVYETFEAPAQRTVPVVAVSAAATKDAPASEKTLPRKEPDSRPVGAKSEQPNLPSTNLVFQYKEQAPKTIYLDK